MKFHRSRFKPQVRKILVVILILAITPIFCQSKKAKTKTSNKKTPSTRTSTDSDDWCYDSASCGPGRWGGVCNSGKRQSPINIPTAKVTTATAVNTRIIVNRNYAIPKTFFVKNTGATLQVSINKDDKSKAFLMGDGLGKDPYYFSQLHFHWGPNNQQGSEHQISGKQFPLEMHLVHKGVKDDDKIAVLSILFYISPNDNPNLTPILRLVGNVRQPKTQVRSGSNKLTLTKLFPKKMKMFRYFGSLTTPPCSEAVIWTVFRNPLPVSANQIAQFRKILNFSNKPMIRNHRPVQPAFTSMRKNIFFVRQKKNDYDANEDPLSGSGIRHDNDYTNDGHGVGDLNGQQNQYFYHPTNGVFWDSAYGFGGYQNQNYYPNQNHHHYNHYHNSQAEWDYWHPEDQQHNYHNDFDIDLYQREQWVDLVSIIQ